MSTENEYRHCPEYRYTLGDCFVLEAEPKDLWCVMAIDFNKREYWLESLSLHVGLNPLEPELAYLKKIRRNISWVDSNSTYHSTYPLDGVEKDGILKYLVDASAVITPLPSDEWQQDCVEYKTFGITQMPAEELIKFSFSFRANGIRITQTAEKAKDHCRITIESSCEKDKQGMVSLDFMKQFEDLIKQYKLYEWSGFRESSPNHQYICESFFLEIEFEGNPQKTGEFFDVSYLSCWAGDSTNIYAEGSSSFPRGFLEVQQEIYNLFDSVKLEKEKRSQR